MKGTPNDRAAKGYDVAASDFRVGRGIGRKEDEEEAGIDGINNTAHISTASLSLLLMYKYLPTFRNDRLSVESLHSEKHYVQG